MIGKNRVYIKEEHETVLDSNDFYLLHYYEDDHIIFILLDTITHKQFLLKDHKRSEALEYFESIKIVDYYEGIKIKGA